MNKSELKAYNWLINEKHYNPKTIYFNGHATPDFVTPDEYYEVKTDYNGNITFSTIQWSVMKPEFNILVFDNSSILPKLNFKFNELLTNNLPIKYTIVTTKNKVHVPTQDQWNIVKKLDLITINAHMPLTPRELAITELIKSHKDNDYIANEFKISIRTVETHITNAMRKFNVHNRFELVRKYKQINKDS